MKYLCHRCCNLLGITSNEIGVNEVGRKSCYGCGGNDDWRLHVADVEELDPKIDAYNAKQKVAQHEN
jgi:hypothetical protein